MSRNLEITQSVARRMKQSSREIVLALVLTLAALAFVFAAAQTEEPETAASVKQRSNTASETR